MRQLQPLTGEESHLGSKNLAGRKKGCTSAVAGLALLDPEPSECQLVVVFVILANVLVVVVVCLGQGYFFIENHFFFSSLNPVLGGVELAGSSSEDPYMEGKA